jgi:hypothetical protein
MLQARVHAGPAGIYCITDNTNEVDRLPLQSELSGPDSSYIQEVAHEPSHLRYLPLDDALYPTQQRFIQPAVMKERRRLLDGSERVAQFMG